MAFKHILKEILMNLNNCAYDFHKLQYQIKWSFVLFFFCKKEEEKIMQWYS